MTGAAVRAAKPDEVDDELPLLLPLDPLDPWDPPPVALAPELV